MDTHPSSRSFRFGCPLALAGLLTTFASVAHGQSSSPVEPSKRTSPSSRSARFAEHTHGSHPRADRRAGDADRRGRRASRARQRAHRATHPGARVAARFRRRAFRRRREARGGDAVNRSTLAFVALALLVTACGADSGGKATQSSEEPCLDDLSARVAAVRSAVDEREGTDNVDEPSGHSTYPSLSAELRRARGRSRRDGRLAGSRRSRGKRARRSLARARKAHNNQAINLMFSPDKFEFSPA